MKKRTLVTQILAGITSVALFALAGCGTQTGTAKADLKPGKVYESSVIAEYNDLGKKGYEAMAEENYEGALAAFRKQADLIPEGRWGYYNQACAHSKAGQTEAAFDALDLAVANGWAGVDHMTSDPDLESIREDPHFTKAVEKAEANLHAGELMAADGLPVYEKPPKRLPDMEAYKTWLGEERDALGLQAQVWHPWQTTLATMDLEAKQIAVREAIQGDAFDHELERITVMTRLKSPYEARWGPLCETIMDEVDTYIQSHDSDSAVSEACYRGISAAIMEHGMAALDTPEGRAGVTKAEDYLKQMYPSSNRYGGAQAWLLAAKLNAAGPAREDVYPEVRDFHARYANDGNAIAVASALIPADMVRATWPIPFDAVDIDGNEVSLADYSGKVVLVDFWATWCGPCRQELPHLKEAYEKYNKNGFEILSVSLDYPERTDQAAYREWIEANGMNWRHIYDEQNWTGALPRAFCVGSIPSPFLVGPDGSLVAMHDDCRGEKLETSIRKALGLSST